MRSDPTELSAVEECFEAFGLDQPRLAAVTREPGPASDPFTGHGGEELAPVEPMDPHELNAMVEEWDNEGGWRWDL